MARVNRVKAYRGRRQCQWTLVDGSRCGQTKGTAVHRTDAPDGPDYLHPFDPGGPKKCGKCGRAIEIGDPYKFVKTKSSPYSSTRRERCATCPNWTQSELTSSPYRSTIYAADETAPDVEVSDDPGAVEESLRALAEHYGQAAAECAEMRIEAADNIVEGFGHVEPVRGPGRGRGPRRGRDRRGPRVGAPGLGGRATAGDRGQVGRDAMSDRVRLEVPARPSIDDPAPAWMQPQMSEATDWERLEMARRFRQADTLLRKALEGIAKQLKDLHEREPIDPDHIAYLAHQTAMASNDVAALVATRNGVIHRLAIDKKGEESLDLEAVIWNDGNPWTWFAEGLDDGCWYCERSVPFRMEERGIRAEDHDPECPWLAIATKLGEVEQ